MKVLFKNTNGSALNSGGIKFISGKEYDVDAKVGKYLVDTFGEVFSEVKAIEKEVKVEEKAKPVSKPKPKGKPVKKVIEG